MNKIPNQNEVMWPKEKYGILLVSGVSQPPNRVEDGMAMAERQTRAILIGGETKGSIREEEMGEEGKRQSQTNL